MTYRATWNGQVIAESDRTVKIEGNQYFLPESLRKELFTPSGTHTVCPWKGTASYYTLTVDGQTNPDAAWYYPTPSPAAQQIRGHVAFWHGVKVQRVNEARPDGRTRADLVVVAAAHGGHPLVALAGARWVPCGVSVP
ncbi:DUF427 domain-containing protein [Streptomyces sp. H10-C2]|uniref:DUF427 domain-containing protein n=1 Tax=unclassified Streptomyces TaxID=2593676 RepID=UPI0024BA68C8|nr:MULTISPECIES: DUF427 domain-containing protein [unclassified Streptomyces]MDJ0346592.1 DUF427 domain-containing protein [Streptomyces sp. PH10-H1]MDJ0375035.1 DUF427 domain-containing protein [Streptomyces sp. H10-C2]